MFENKLFVHLILEIMGLGALLAMYYKNRYSRIITSAIKLIAFALGLKLIVSLFNYAVSSITFQDILNVLMGLFK